MTKSLILGLMVATVATTANANSVADLSRELSKSLELSMQATGGFTGEMVDAGSQTLNGASRTADKYILQPVKASATQTAASVNEYILAPVTVHAKTAANWTLNEVLVPTKDGVLAIGSASIDALSATKDHVIVPVALSVKGTAVDSYQFIVVDVKDFSVEMGRNTYQEVLMPIGQTATAAGQTVIKYAKITAGEALNLAKMSGNATVDTAKFSGGLTVDGAQITGGAMTQIGAVSADASSGMSDLSADAAVATANVGRKMVGLPAVERRSKERQESSDALKGN